MGLRDLGGALWRQRVLVLLVLLAVAVTCPVGVALAPRTYTATAVLAAQADPAVDTGGASADSLRGRLAAMADDPAVVAEALSGTGRDPREVAGRVSGRAVPGTSLIEVTVEDRDPRVAAATATAVAEALPDRDRDDVFQLGVLERAVPPSQADGPDVALVVLLAAVLAAVLAALAAVVRDSRVRTVADAAAAEVATSAPLLAHLAAPTDPDVMPALHPGTAGAARFTGLVASIDTETATGTDTATVRRSGGQLVVAGSGEGEAAAWVAANLAIALAATQRTTLLVDGRLGSRFGRPGPGGPETAGLHEVLTGTEIAAAISPGPVRGLSVLPAGGWGLEPQPGLVEARFGSAMQQARGRFDTVVVIGPPLDASDDARSMASGAELLMVVPERRLPAAELRTHADRVREGGARLLGVVLVGPARRPVTGR